MDAAATRRHAAHRAHPSDRTWLALSHVTRSSRPPLHARAIVTAISNHVDNSSAQERTTEERGPERPCPINAAHTNLEIHLASGTVVDVTTDARGQVSINLPADEPDHGKITVSAKTGPLSRHALRYATAAVTVGEH